jgi:hypothetical protein
VVVRGGRERHGGIRHLHKSAKILAHQSTAQILVRWEAGDRSVNKCEGNGSVVLCLQIAFAFVDHQNPSPGSLSAGAQ